MSFVVSARKYRPQNFDELVGQDHIAQTLKNAIKNDQLAHAFLFSGPRGVGKTTSARILAKVLNCENLQEGYKACNTCSSCKSFMENASFNIFELDAASNNSVEHIRALNEQVRFQPQQGSYKIYIIDEVHMLSQAAFNAFLKTLEEPPSYAKFILATTEKHKIIPTILSRCQIFDFRRIQLKDIVAQLKKISGEEGRNIDEEALHLIAQKSDGALRDALSIFDKVISSVDGDISYKEVADNLNILDYDYFFRIVDSAIKEDLPALMLTLDEIFKYGFEPEQLTLGMMEHLRQLLLVKDLKTASLVETGNSLKTRYENQAALCSGSFILSALSVLNQCDIDLVRSQNKRLSVEIAFSKVAFLNRIVDKKKLFDEEPTTLKKENPPQKETRTEKEIHPSEVMDLTEEKSPKPENSDSNETISETKPVGKPAKPKSKARITSISSDVSVLLNDIKAKDLKSREDALDLNADNLRKIFDDYRENVESKAIQTALEYTAFEIEKDVIRILTPTQIYIDYIRQELRLVTLLHDSFKTNDFKISFEIREETFPNYTPPQKPKHLTTKEKYDLFLNINPKFEQLVDEFKMKLNN